MRGLTPCYRAPMLPSLLAIEDTIRGPGLDRSAEVVLFPNPPENVGPFLHQLQNSDRMSICDPNRRVLPPGRNNLTNIYIVEYRYQT
jgi:hypothetical protein